METFDAPDGTRLAYHRSGGPGDPLICVPGGPMQASAYLAGLPARHPLVRLDLRGTGDSATPADPATYRCDRQVGDLEALRAHLGVQRMDLLAHSAGATIALLYAARHPQRIARLVLVAPSPRPVGIEVTGEERRAVADRRCGEPWFPEASAALERIRTGVNRPGDWTVITPFVYGRWDEDTQAYAAEGMARTNRDAAAAYYGAGALDPAEVRAALARLAAPVVLVTGELDIQLPPARAAEYAAMFPGAELHVLAGAGHFPWRDDLDRVARHIGVHH